MTRRVVATLLGALYAAGVMAAPEPASGILGKNEWLFYRHELTDASDADKTNTTLDLIQRFNKVLAAKGIAMGVAMVPLKMRVYAEHLPDELKINPYMAANNERMSRLLRDSGVAVTDLHGAFMSSPKRASDSPLFFRLDQNWSPTGVLVAAEAVKTGIAAAPALQRALADTPEEEFKLLVGSKKRASKGRDLIQYLPPGAPSFAPEQVTPISVSRAQPPKLDAAGKRLPSAITLLGSGFSNDWTGFADALRYALQRDLQSIGVGTDQGSWVGMESYLQSDAFQNHAPKLLIWEMPERDMRAAPDYKFREARYQSDNTEWLLRVSALVQTDCKPSPVTPRLLPTGLAANAAHVKGADLATGAVQDADFVEIGFDKPLEPGDYLSARASTQGDKPLVLEGSGAGAPVRRFTYNLAADGAPHALKTPLPSRGAGFTKLRIYPGQGASFALQGLQLCRQPIP